MSLDPSRAVPGAHTVETETLAETGDVILNSCLSTISKVVGPVACTVPVCRCQNYAGLSLRNKIRDPCGVHCPGAAGFRPDHEHHLRRRDGGLLNTITTTPSTAIAMVRPIKIQAMMTLIGEPEQNLRGGNSNGGSRFAASVTLTPMKIQSVTSPAKHRRSARAGIGQPGACDVDFYDDPKQALRRNPDGARRGCGSVSFF
jgi:hypothetical protein